MRWDRSSTWIERRPPKAKVGSSNLPGPEKLAKSPKRWKKASMVLNQRARWRMDCMRAGTDGTAGRIGLVLALLMLLAQPLAAQSAIGLPARTYIITADARDALDKPVPDALVLVQILPPGELPGVTNQTGRLLEARTSGAGRARILLGVAANQSVPAAYLSVYTPYWSSAPKALNLPEIPADAIVQEVTMPLTLDTYRIRLSDAQGNPIAQARVQLTQPFPLVAFTDANGLMQTRLPAGRNVEGNVFYQRNAENFSFGSKTDASGIHELGMFAPFHKQAKAWNESHGWDVRLFDSMGRPLALEDVRLSSGGLDWVYRADRDGWVHAREIPNASVNFSWTGYNYTYSFDINLNSAGTKLQMPLLLTITDPAKAELGDSCYRIDVNVTDARRDPSLQVNARSSLGSGALPFTLDRTVPIQNNSGVRFSRILCVEQDTGFEIGASNTFERTALQIQLKVTASAAPVDANYTKPPPPGVLERGKVADDPRRLETALILVYVLFALVVVLMAVHFKNRLLYYAQSILRFTYTSYKDRLEAEEGRRVEAQKKEDGKKGLPQLKR